MKRLLAFSLILCILLSGCHIGGDQAYTPTGDALVLDGMDPDSLNPAADTEPQELTLTYYADLSMNPLKSSSTTNRVLFSLIYQGLFSVSSDYEATPILCQYYRVSPTNKTWTIYLDPDARFSDGTAVTAADVLASYEAAQSHKTYSGRFGYVDSITIADDGAIVFALDAPMENLPLLLDVPILKAGEVDADYPLGSGPYTFRKTVSGAQLRKNDAWWCSSSDLVVTATAIAVTEAQSTSLIRDEFEFSGLNLVCADPCSSDFAEYRGDFELWTIDSGIMVYLGVNVNWSHDDIFLETGLRSILTYAIDREKIVAEYYNGLAYPATLAASPLSPYYSESLAANYAYDPVKFLDKLSGYGMVSATNKIRLLVNQDDILRLRTARLIAATLTDLGLPTETVEKDTSGYIATLKNGEYDLYLGQTKLSPNMDLTEFFRTWGNISYNGMSNEALHSLCLDALANEGNYYNLHKAVAEDGRLIPILFGCCAVYATRGIVSDMSPSRDNVFCYTIGRTLADAKLETVYE